MAVAASAAENEGEFFMCTLAGQKVSQKVTINSFFFLSKAVHLTGTIFFKLKNIHVCICRWFARYNDFICFVCTASSSLISGTGLYNTCIVQQILCIIDCIIDFFIVDFITDFCIKDCILSVLYYRLYNGLLCSRLYNKLLYNRLHNRRIIDCTIAIMYNIFYNICLYI